MAPMATMRDLTGVACVGYVRVSTEKQVGEVHTSLDDQRAAVERLAAALGVSVGAWFADEGASGGTAEGRPAFMALWASCQASRRTPRTPAFVLALNDSRWGRFGDTEEGAYWRIAFAKVGWRVRFAEHDDVTDPAARTIMRAIGGVQASQYRAAVKANAKRGMQGTTGQGFWAAAAPFGYRRQVVWPAGRERVLESGVRKAPDEKVRLVPHADEAAVVRTLFARYAGGTESLDSLVECALTAWPHRPWTAPALRHLLKNPAYTGDVVFGRKRADAHEQRALGKFRPPSEWYGKADAHDAIISRAIFAAVQARFAFNRAHTKGARRDWLVTGIVRCRCGKHFVAGGAGGRAGSVPSYRCVTRGKHPSGHCAYPGAVTKPALEAAVIDTVADVVGSPRVQAAVARALTIAMHAVVQAPETQRGQLVVRLDTTADRRRRLLTAIEEGTIAHTDAAARIAELRAEEQRLRAQLDRLGRPAEAVAALSEQRARLLGEMRDFRRAVQRLQGPALREKLRPWIASAVFNTETRMLDLAIRRLPAALADEDFDSLRPPTAGIHGTTGATGIAGVIVRKVRVAGRGGR